MRAQRVRALRASGPAPLAALALCLVIGSAARARAGAAGSRAPTFQLSLDFPAAASTALIATRTPVAAPALPPASVTLRLGLLPAEPLRLGALDGAPRLGLTLSHRYLDLGLSAGTQLSDEGRPGLSLAGHLRLGAGDGVNLTARYGYLVARDPFSGAPRADRLGPQGRFLVPLGPRLALTADGTFLGDGGALATLGLSHRLAGDGGPGSWFISAGLGFTFQHARQETGRGSAETCSGVRWCVTPEWSAAPAATIGIERRF